MARKYGMVLASLLLVGGCNMGQYEEPRYQAVVQAENIEIRDYAPVIAAQVEVEGPRQEAIRQGFRTIADFIFGNNVTRSSIAMTAPVVQQASESISMTAPVIQQREGENRWRVQFIMPSEYTLATLPKPNNPAVHIVPVAARKMVVIRFSGSRGDENILEKTQALRAYVEKAGLKTKGEPVLAFYDPPWTLPFLRRNEVMMELTTSHPTSTKSVRPR